MRRLNLKKETLAELTSDELGGVVGGTMPTKFDCTESHQICTQPSVDICIVIPRTRIACIPTQSC